MVRRESSEAIASVALSTLARNSPDQITLTGGDEEYTALELNELINGCAHLLQQVSGVPKFLPILLGANISSIIAYHAAIRSRTRFALIDSNINSDYLKLILARLGSPRYLINTNSQFMNLEGIEEIPVGRNRSPIFDAPNVNLQEPASVLFTSGSTGEPKGVIWDWKIFDHLFESNREYYQRVGGFQKMGRFSSLAFTAGAWQAMSVVQGNHTYMLDSNQSADQIIEFVNSHNITNLAFSTSFGEQLFERKSPELHFSCVDNISIYGESVNWVQISKLEELAGHKAEIRSTYGSSEAPGSMIHHHLRSSVATDFGRVPLGNINEDRNIDLLPLEGGDGLHEFVMKRGIALGYFENELLTRQKFVEQSDRSILYMSGDLVRINSEGDINYAGRSDDLVKINGRLVEPSESERVLSAVVGIRTLAVIPYTNSSGKSILIAHLAIDPKSTLTPKKIYSELLASLPSNLLPSKLVRHDEIPLGPNGKVDRQYLLNRDWPRWRDEGESTALNIHQKFALIQLRQILKKPDLAPSEDIFGAGMDSLLAIEFEVRAKNYGYGAITPSIFLEYRTAIDIGEHLSKAGPLLENNIIELNKNGIMPPIFLFPGAGVTAIFYKELADEVGLDQKIVIIEPRGLHTKQDIEKTIDEMAQSAAQEISRLYPQGPVHLLGHSAGSMIACVTGMLLSKDGRAVLMISLDAIEFADQIALGTKKYSLIAKWERVKNLLKRSPKSVKESLSRRIKAKNRSTYEFFTLHIGGLSLRHRLSAKPDFKIHILYCQPKQRFEDWKRSALLSYEQVEGTHLTLLDHQYLPDIVSKISNFFNLAKKSN